MKKSGIFLAASAMLLTFGNSYAEDNQWGWGWGDNNNNNNNQQNQQHRNGQQNGQWDSNQQYQRSNGQRYDSQQRQSGMSSQDQRIHNNIVAKLSKKPNYSIQEISIMVNDGVVTLEGFVESADSKSMIEKDLKNISGVKEVKNKLKVRSGAHRGQNQQYRGQSQYYDRNQNMEQRNQHQNQYQDQNQRHQQSYNEQYRGSDRGYYQTQPY